MELLLPKIEAPAPTLPSYVKLDMAFGVGAGATLYDKTRYRSHGAITTATWAAGLHGYCLDFVAANPDHVVIPAAHTQLNFVTEDFSIVARVRFDTVVAPRQIIVARGLIDTDGWQVEAQGSYLMVRANRLPASRRARSPNLTLVVDTWYTLGATRDGAVGYVFMNGVDITEDSHVMLDPVTNNRHCTIGVNTDLATEGFDGKIEFLRVFGGVALTASEHLAWHRALA